ncbi:unnamed protein product [Protopolystoma xenopodis]|uniref:Uncharacterized protein n=1 Tax=Protopolystoma xenopodis TaxID=117903 RepID=A0A448WEG8_9PLAT|nr:unnamed protein product [Protopolystoma xenopodis]
MHQGCLSDALRTDALLQAIWRPLEPGDRLNVGTLSRCEAMRKQDSINTLSTPNGISRGDSVPSGADGGAGGDGAGEVGGDVVSDGNMGVVQRPRHSANQMLHQELAASEIVAKALRANLYEIIRVLVHRHATIGDVKDFFRFITTCRISELVSDFTHCLAKITDLLLRPQTFDLRDTSDHCRYYEFNSP